ncbi:MAG: SAM-dependent methyltransferase [bacterium]|nr:SAM-dependent methyltransferase [bacterium]
MGGDPLRLASSFRDPSGFLFSRDGVIYRQINSIYREDYDRLTESGLCRELVDAGLMIPHEEVDAPPADPETAYKIIRPEVVPFISYPYEWCFSGLKDAALATLEIQRCALERGMTLKDASAFNIQFIGGRPVLIDTLSFERYREGMPWAAYRQFCQHFLAPLALMARADARLGCLLGVYIDGVPLDLASALLPLRSRFSFRLLSHIHLHAAAQRRGAGSGKPVTARLSRFRLLALIDNLRGAVAACSWRPPKTAWSAYYEATTYAPEAFEHKRRTIGTFLDVLAPRSVWDMGANTGVFSRVAAAKGIPTVSLDGDRAAVEMNYLACRKEGERKILPLVMDLTNPSPSLGWAHRERMSLAARGPADAVMALALIHHVAIANNVPLAAAARYFRELGRGLIIEFVPKEDSNVQRMLATREDIFPDYTERRFEEAFGRHFTVEAREAVPGSRRAIYLMKRRAV